MKWVNVNDLQTYWVFRDYRYQLKGHLYRRYANTLDIDATVHTWVLFTSNPLSLHWSIIYSILLTHIDKWSIWPDAQQRVSEVIVYTF